MPSHPGVPRQGPPDSLKMPSGQAYYLAMSSSVDAASAAQALRAQLPDNVIDTVIFFCSAEYDLEQLGLSLKHAFSGIQLLGCTTAGEISAQGYGQGCITAIGFNKALFSVAAVSIDQLSGFSLTDAQAKVDQLIRHSSAADVAPIKGHSFALTLLDGLSIEEENVLATLSAALGSIPSFGGSAGDDIHLARTHVFYDGAFHNDAAVVMLFNTGFQFQVFSTHHMQPLSEKLVVTAADVDKRRVLELNAEPAAVEYSRLIGVPVAALTPEVFALNPLAVRIGDDYFIRSIQQVNDDNSLTFYCAVETGIVMTQMQPGDMAANMRECLSSIDQAIGKPQLIIGCDCFLRRLECQLQGSAAEISQLLRENRVIGFNTYGEQLEGRHINQTFTGVAIGHRLPPQVTDPVHSDE